jgi:uncharacterized protein YbjT (DUF2867 family)
VKTLVSGATGFVGRHVAAALDAAGHDVTAMTRRPEEYRGSWAGLASVVDEVETTEVEMTHD